MDHRLEGEIPGGENSMYKTSITTVDLMTIGMAGSTIPLARHREADGGRIGFSVWN